MLAFCTEGVSSYRVVAAHRRTARHSGCSVRRPCRAVMISGLLQICVLCRAVSRRHGIRAILTSWSYAFLCRTVLSTCRVGVCTRSVAHSYPEPVYRHPSPIGLACVSRLACARHQPRDHMCVVHRPVCTCDQWAPHASACRVWSFRLRTMTFVHTMFVCERVASHVIRLSWYACASGCSSCSD